MEQLIGGIEVYLRAGSLLSLAAAFLGGALTSFTPCVYPLIPITASYVAGRNVGGSALRGFALSLSYVTGMAVTYSGLGMAAALTGSLFGELGTNPWAYFIVANVVIILGMGMLGVFELPFVGISAQPKPGGILSVFFVGIASGFVAGPCTAPVLGILLAYVAGTGDVFFGAALLFVFAFGMGALLLIIGTFSSIVAALPRSGEWMATVKKVLGLIMIGLGEYLLIKMGQLII
jgi:cytochrome c-type biogenesis protein